MKGNFLVILLLLTILFTGEVFAQKQKPNFSGIWNLDIPKSTFTRGLEPFYKENKHLVCSNQLIINHKEPALNIEERILCSVINEPNSSSPHNESATFYTDGRGEVNQIPDYVKLITATKWVRNKILVKNKLGKKPLFTEYFVSEDGKVLTKQSYNDLSSSH